MGKTVIGIDDDQDDLDMMGSVLIQIDPHIRYIEFTHPMEAVRQLCVEAFPLPDYIFLDLNMPMMSGSAYLVELRKVVRLVDVQIIILSTCISEKNSDSLKKDGAAFTFLKPNSVKGYVDILKDLFHKDFRIKIATHNIPDQPVQLEVQIDQVPGISF